MGIGIAPKIDTLNLSKGQSFVHNVLLGSETYPEGTSASIIIKDDSEIVLATWYGTVNGVRAYFSEDADDTIPHGSKFDLFLYYPDGTNVKHSYGRVVRNENRYPLLATSVVTNYALQFSDSFDRTYVGKYWIPRSASNAVSIHDNSGSTPNTLGPNNAFFTDAAVLWYAPLNTDSVTVSAAMVNIGYGKCTLIVASDYSMTSWVGVQFETGIANNKLWIVRGTGPTTWAAQSGTTAVNNTLTTGDTYVVKFNAVSKVISCFKNNSGTAAISGTATGLPTGAGYRYAGIVWNSSLFSPGAEPSSWSAKDGL
jgi:hypothetical protein